MLIVKLILYKNKRFFLNNITKLTYEPINSIQIILGRNGSGKTSLLKELNPFPINSKDYYNDGYKEINILHNDKLYILYSSKNTNSFKVGDNELNTSGTKSIQIELIKEHFNLTSKDMNIIYDNTKFTNLNPAERKNFLSELSNISYDYSFNILKNAKNANRELAGAIKLLTNNIDKNKQVIISEEEIANNIQIKKELNDILHAIYLHYESLENKNIDTKYYISKVDEVAKSLADANLMLFANVMDLKEKINNKVNDFNNCTENIKRLYKNIDNYKMELECNKKEIEITNAIKELRTSIEKFDKEALKEELLEYKSMILKDSIDYYKTNLHNDIIASINTIDNNVNISILPKLKEDQNNLNMTIMKINAEIKAYSREIHNMENSYKGNITCNVCNNVIAIDYKDNISKLQDKININKNKLDVLNNTMDNLVINISKINTKINTIKSILEILENNTRIFNNLLYPIIRKLDTENNTIVIEELNALLIKIDNTINYLTYKEELTILESKLSNNKEIQNNINNKTNNRIKELENEVSKDITLKNELETEIKDLQEKISYTNKYIDVYDKLEKLYKYRHYIIDNNIKQERNEFLNELIKEIKEELINLDNKVKENEIASRELKDSLEKLEEYKERERMTKILIEELGPNKGIIKDSLNVFINKVIREVNELINCIWSYKLELIELGGEDIVLDYKFKVRVDDNEIIEDISKSSSSMQEIINLAFKLLYYRYKRYTDIPLYLDEFGTTFDKTHRATAYGVIDKILSNEFIQVFLICHYESLYGSMVNCDFIVLDKENISLENINFNKVLTLE